MNVLMCVLFQEMYQFVFSIMGVPLPFCLHLSYPNCQLTLPSMANSPIDRMKNSVVFIHSSEDKAEIVKQMENLADPEVIVSIYKDMYMCVCIHVKMLSSLYA